MEALCGLIERAAVSRSVADDSRKPRRVAAHQIEGFIERTAPRVRCGVVVVAPSHGDGAKECIHRTRAVFLDDFQRPSRLLIAD